MILCSNLIASFSTTSPADYEVRAVIRFLNAKNTRPAEKHGIVRNWCSLINGGRKKHA